MTYEFLKALHLLGVLFLVGNVTVTSVWKVFADRTHNAVIVAFAQRMVTLTDLSFTLAGIVFTIVGGYGMVVAAELDPFGTGWLVWGQLLFVVSGILWAAVLVPIQVRQARAARSFVAGAPVPDAYRRDARGWIFWGIIATVPLVAAAWVMVVKP
jgi:uncharacterized membrane protein